MLLQVKYKYIYIYIYILIFDELLGTSLPTCMAIAYSSLSLLLQAAATGEATALKVTSPCRRVLRPQRFVL